MSMYGSYMRDESTGDYFVHPKLVLEAAHSILSSREADRLIALVMQRVYALEHLDERLSSHDLFRELAFENGPIE